MTQTASDSALSADGEQRRFASLDPRTGEVVAHHPIHTAAEVEDSYYDRPATVFAASQRSLCNKCHIKD